MNFKKHFLIILICLLCSCDPIHKYAIYNNYGDDITIEIKREFENQKETTRRKNIDFSEEFEELFLGHSFRIKENHLPIKINIYNKNKLYFSYDKKWLINELKRNNLYGKSYVLLILDKNGLHPVLNTEYKNITQNNIKN